MVDVNILMIMTHTAKYYISLILLFDVNKYNLLIIHIIKRKDQMQNSRCKVFIPTDFQIPHYVLSSVNVCNEQGILI